MLATALDAFMAPFDTAKMPIFFMCAIRTSTRKVVIAANSQIVLVHSLVPFLGLPAL